MDTSMRSSFPSVITLIWFVCFESALQTMPHIFFAPMGQFSTSEEAEQPSVNCTVGKDSNSMFTSDKHPRN